MNSKKLAIKKGIKDLRFSWGWLQKFLKRHHFAIRRSSKNYHLADHLMNQKATIFVENIRKLVKERGYKRQNILNMDETGVYRDSPYNAVIDVKGKKNIKVITGGHEKSRVTYVPTISMDGGELTALILLPGKGIRNKINVVTGDNLRVIYTGTNSTWMDAEIMRDDYIKEVLQPFSRTLGPDERALLLLDNLSAHKDDLFLKRANDLGVDVEFLPANTTGKLQPLDLSYNSAFKMHYSALWEKWFLTNCTDKITAHIQDSQINKNEEVKELEIVANKKDAGIQRKEQEDLDLRINLSKFPSPDWDQCVLLIKKFRELIEKSTIEAGFDVYGENMVVNVNITIKDRHSISLSEMEQVELLNEWKMITTTGILLPEEEITGTGIGEETDDAWTPPSNLEELLDLDIDLDVDDA